MKKKYRKRKLPKYFFIISLALFLFVGIGYSVINSNLTMQGNVVRKATSWSIGFSNPVFDTGSKTTPIPTITNGTTMTMNVNLTNPGDIYAFTVDLTNNGSVPALINTLNITELTEEQKVYLRWKVEYEDESPLEVGDLLKAGETKKVHIYLEYKNLRAKDLYPSAPINLNLTVQANFYLPEETFNTVTVTKNESTKLVQVSNLIQEATLDDFPIESDDQVIACNNGVEPSTDTNNKIVLSKVKQNATCRIESSLADAVTNSGAEVTNMAFINDTNNESQTTILQTQNININLNGKNVQFNQPLSQKNISIFKIYGVLNITDKKTGGMLGANYRLMSAVSGGVININGGTYKRTDNTSENAGGVIVVEGAATLNVKNSNIISTNAWTIYTASTSPVINIYDSYIESDAWGIATYTNTVNAIINVKNSTIKSNNNVALSYSGSSTGNIYLCNSQIISGDIYDVNNINDSKSYIYFSNTTFTNGVNKPIVHNNYINNYASSDIACAE